LYFQRKLSASSAFGYCTLQQLQQVYKWSNVPEAQVSREIADAILLETNPDYVAQNLIDSLQRLEQLSGVEAIIAVLWDAVSSKAIDSLGIIEHRFDDFEIAYVNWAFNNYLRLEGWLESFDNLWDAIPNHSQTALISQCRLLICGLAHQATSTSHKYAMLRTFMAKVSIGAIPIVYLEEIWHRLNDQRLLCIAKDVSGDEEELIRKLHAIELLFPFSGSTIWGTLLIHFNRWHQQLRKKYSFLSVNLPCRNTCSPEDILGWWSAAELTLLLDQTTYSPVWVNDATQNLDGAVYCTNIFEALEAAINLAQMPGEYAKGLRFYMMLSKTVILASSGDAVGLTKHLKDFHLYQDYSSVIAGVEMLRFIPTSLLITNTSSKL
jgi:hypothetical protein